MAMDSALLTRILLLLEILEVFVCGHPLIKTCVFKIVCPVVPNSSTRVHSSADAHLVIGLQCD